jgi:hypothetical protein
MLKFTDVALATLMIILTNLLFYYFQIFNWSVETVVQSCISGIGGFLYAFIIYRMRPTDRK